MLLVSHLCKVFGNVRAVDQLDLSVERGQIRGLLGPNGAGKSTAIRMMCGVLTPNSGSVQIDRVNLAKQPRLAKQSLGYVPEGAPLPLELLPNEYFHFSGSMYGLSKSDRVQAIGYWADRCDISDVLSTQIGSLSRGYKQRVALVAALLHKPKLLVLDEPSTGLDPAQNASFRALLREVSSEAAILYSSHHLAEVEATCDVVSIVNHGKLIVDTDFKNLSQEHSSITVECSPPEISNSLHAISVEKLNDTWIRCTVDVGKKTVAEAGEEISDIVMNAGGKIRLLQPSSQSLESSYLRIIQESEMGVIA